MRQLSMFERYLDAMTRTGDITLRWLYQKEMMKELIMSKAELDYIVEQVLRRIHITVDASQVVNEIEAIKKAIDSLGKRG